MSRLYGAQHRKLQDEFGTRKMADRVEELVCKTEFDDNAKAFSAIVKFVFAHQFFNAVCHFACAKFVL